MQPRTFQKRDGGLLDKALNWDDRLCRIGPRYEGVSAKEYRSPTSSLHCAVAREKRRVCVLKDSVHCESFVKLEDERYVFDI